MEELANRKNTELVPKTEILEKPLLIFFLKPCLIVLFRVSYNDINFMEELWILYQL